MNYGQQTAKTSPAGAGEARNSEGAGRGRDGTCGRGGATPLEEARKEADKAQEEFRLARLAWEADSSAWPRLDLAIKKFASAAEAEVQASKDSGKKLSLEE